MIFAGVFVLMGSGLLLATFFELRDESKFVNDMSSHTLEMKYDHQ